MWCSRRIAQYTRAQRIPLRWGVRILWDACRRSGACAVQIASMFAPAAAAQGMRATAAKATAALRALAVLPVGYTVARRRAQARGGAAATVPVHVRRRSPAQLRRCTPQRVKPVCGLSDPVGCRIAPVEAVVALTKETGDGATVHGSAAAALPWRASQIGVRLSEAEASVPEARQQASRSVPCSSSFARGRARWRWPACCRKLHVDGAARRRGVVGVLGRYMHWCRTSAHL